RISSSCALSSSPNADLASSKRVRPGANSSCCSRSRALAPACRRTSPASGLSSPARMRMSVVLPAPFGPTKPTRSPWYSSNDRSSNSGPRSYARMSPVQLSNSIHDPPGGNAQRRMPNDRGGGSLGIGHWSFLRTSAAFDLEPGGGGLALGEVAGFQDQFPRLVLLAVEPELVAEQEVELRVVGVRGDRLAEGLQVVVERLGLLPVQVAGVEPGLGPVGPDVHPGGDRTDRFAVLAECELGLGDEEIR